VDNCLSTPLAGVDTAQARLRAVPHRSPRTKFPRGQLPVHPLAGVDTASRLRAVHHGITLLPTTILKTKTGGPGAAFSGRRGAVGHRGSGGRRPHARERHRRGRDALGDQCAPSGGLVFLVFVVLTCCHLCQSARYTFDLGPGTGKPHVEFLRSKQKARLFDRAGLFGR